MSINFDSNAAKRGYSDRDAAADWRDFARRHFDPSGLDAVDIGCGGGIYSRALRDLGAASVVGVDGAAQYVEEAAAAGEGDAAVRFVRGDASATGLPDRCCDRVLSRALVHHLDDQGLRDNALEMRRLLRPGGIAVVQDRSFEDAVASDDEFWIRRTLFACHPKLEAFERARRPATGDYVRVLEKAGLSPVRVETFGETRRVHHSIDALCDEVHSRKGKSILFELNDDELAGYVEALRAAAPDGPVVERDRWTFWIAGVA